MGHTPSSNERYWWAAHDTGSLTVAENDQCVYFSCSKIVTAIIFRRCLYCVYHITPASTHGRLKEKEIIENTGHLFLINSISFEDRTSQTHTCSPCISHQFTCCPCCRESSLVNLSCTDYWNWLLTHLCTSASCTNVRHMCLCHPLCRS
jgi:hypothetical protein